MSRQGRGAKCRIAGLIVGLAVARGGPFLKAQAAPKIEPPIGLLYSAACAVSMNCETHILRRFRLARYIASNFSGGKEWVEGRLTRASAQALRRGNFSIWPSLLTRSRKK